MFNVHWYFEKCSHARDLEEQDLHEGEAVGRYPIAQHSLKWNRYNIKILKHQLTSYRMVAYFLDTICDPKTVSSKIHFMYLFASAWNIFFLI